MTSLSEESLAFQITLWGKSLIVDDDFTFTLTNKLYGKKLKPIWIHLYKKNITDKEIDGIMDELDGDGNGTIEFDEFLTFMK